MEANGNEQQPSVPGPGHKRLEVWVGKWNTRGEMKAGPSGQVIPIKGTDSYEWVAGGYFLAHHVDVSIGAEEVRVIEIIGYDAATQQYPMHSFDNQGNHAVMHASVSGNAWTLTAESQRSTLVVNPDGKSMHAKWEQLKDGTRWEPWMDLELTRQA